jgi:hypothetical protein
MPAISATATARSSSVRRVADQEDVARPISIIKDGAGEPTVEQLAAVDLINRMFLSQDKGGQ